MLDTPQGGRGQDPPWLYPLHRSQFHGPSNGTLIQACFPLCQLCGTSRDRCLEAESLLSGALLLGVGTCHPGWGPRPVSPGGTPSGLNLLTPTAKLCKRRSSVQPPFPRRRPLFRVPRRGRGTGAPAFAVPPACAAGERTKGDAVTPGGGAPRLPSPRPAPARAPFAATPAPALVPTRCPP